MARHTSTSTSRKKSKTPTLPRGKSPLTSPLVNAIREEFNKEATLAAALLDDTSISEERHFAAGVVLVTVQSLMQRVEGVALKMASSLG